jgi:hypothetical protein
MEAYFERLQSLFETAIVTIKWIYECGYCNNYNYLIRECEDIKACQTRHFLLLMFCMAFVLMIIIILCVFTWINTRQSPYTRDSKAKK